MKNMSHKLWSHTLVFIESGRRGIRIVLLMVPNNKRLIDDLTDLGDGILIKIIFGSLLGKGYVMFSTRRTTCLLDIIEAGNWRSQMIKCCRLKCYFYCPESHSLFAIHCHLNESLRTQLTAPELRSSFNTRSHRKMHFLRILFSTPVVAIDRWSW